MTRTAVSLYMGMFNPNLKSGSTFASSNTETWFTDLNDLKNGNTVQTPITTLEPNYWLLDGTQPLVYETQSENESYFHAGLLSNKLTDSSGEFTVADRPVLTITLASASHIDGLTFVFNRLTGDWATDIHVRYFTPGVYHDRTYQNNSYYFSTQAPFDNVLSLEITFLSTNKPYRRLRLAGFDFGNAVQLANNSIKDATVTKMVDPISSSLPFNTADIKVITNDPAFSIMEPSGEYLSLYERQPISIYESVDDEEFFIGEYFLDTWEAESEQVMSLHFVDVVGTLDTLLRQGRVLPNDTFGNQAAIVVGDTIAYEIDSATALVQVQGVINKGTLREQLQQLAFAAGAMMVINNGVIRFEKAPNLAVDTESSTITIDKIGIDTKVVLKPLITGVKLTSYTWSQSTETTPLFDGAFYTTSRLYSWDTPVGAITVTGNSGATSYTSLTATSAMVKSDTGANQTGTIVGYPMQALKNIYSITNLDLPVTTTPNVAVIEDAIMISESNYASVIRTVYDYLNYRYKMTTKLVTPPQRVGEIVVTATIQGKYIKGVVEKMVMNLSGGFVVETEIVGVLYVPIV